MQNQLTHPDLDLTMLNQAVDRAIRAIPPAWPLASSVAVNPFLGQVDEGLTQLAARFERIAGASPTMPRHWYAAQIAKGDITDNDLIDALANAQMAGRPNDIGVLKTAAQTARPQINAVPTIADLAARVSGIDWPGLITERFGAWAAGYFDEGQALWAAPRAYGAYAAWRAVATHDLTPEIIGLAGFANHVAAAPEKATEALGQAAKVLALPPAAWQTYFHQLLNRQGGWAQYARYQLWQAELAGRTDHTLHDFLAIQLIWESALFARYGQQIAADWQDAKAIHASPLIISTDHAIDAILQEAAERGAQRRLALTLAAPAIGARDSRPAMQAAFCIDVRSEIFRRALESIQPSIQTLGFAGFFGLTAAHRRFASDVIEHRLPVLLNPGLNSVAGGPEQADADHSARYKARAARAWGRFKLAAVSSFAFVEATGPVYIAKLLHDALGMTKNKIPDDPMPRLDPAIDLQTRINMAESVLRAMSLTSNFARLVILAGHGANVVNNPHASALHCGACGGYSGEVNARLLATLLNDRQVRDGLSARGIIIPTDTLFIAGLHDTTTDQLTLFDQDCPLADHDADVNSAKLWLASAARITRAERALRLPHSGNEQSVVQRSRNWAEVRPEWALAGCQAFIAAPRLRTSGKSLEGRAFLHDYDWMQDKNFSVLELIMTAPVIVASWISLQYYGSTVMPDHFGGGNKLIHNVVGGMGVVEGNGGVMRAGLPWQSVHDGEKFIHQPLRLSVCIEAPREAMGEILQRHDQVRALFDNGWLHLFALDQSGHMAWRYAGNLQWTAVDLPELAQAPLSKAV
jgi:uncharacterized protein YbcC (UPF0753/DUF2309 family)